MARLAALALLLLALLPSLAHGQAPPPPTPALHRVGQAGGDTLHVAGDGRYLYWSAGPRLIALDAADPSAPQVVGAGPPFDHLIHGLAVAGGRAYVTTALGETYYRDFMPFGVGAFYVLDLADPGAPRLLGSLAVPDGSAVAADARHAYVGDRDGTVHVIDVLDPAAPREVGSYRLADGGPILDLAVVGDHVYAASRRRLSVLDVSDPTRPTPVGTSDLLTCSVSWITVVGSRAYATGCRLYVLDVADPARPRVLGESDFASDLRDVGVVGDRAYVTTLRGVAVYDVSDPTRPTPVASAASPGGDLVGVAIQNGFGYAAERGFATSPALRTIDLRDRDAPRFLSSRSLPSNSRGVAVRGGFAYVADGDAGLSVLDLSTPALPREVGRIDTHIAQRVAVDGDHAYVADDAGGVRVVDVRDPRAPLPVGHLPTVRAFDVAVADGVALVADRQGGLRVGSVADPTRPTVLAALPPTENSEAWSVVASGGYAFLSETTPGGHGTQQYGRVRVVDVRVPSSPRAVATVESPSAPYALALGGDRLYVAESATSGGGGHALRVVDVADPSRPASVHVTPLTAAPTGLAVADGRLWLTELTGAVRVYSLADRDRPAEVASTALPPVLYGVAVEGGRAHVAGRNFGVWALLFAPWRVTLPLAWG